MSIGLLTTMPSAPSSLCSHTYVSVWAKMRIDHAGHGDQEVVGEVGGGPPGATHASIVNAAPPGTIGDTAHRPANSLDMHALAIRQVARAAGPALAPRRSPCRLRGDAPRRRLTVMHGFADYTSARCGSRPTGPCRSRSRSRPTAKATRVASRALAPTPTTMSWSRAHRRPRPGDGLPLPHRRAGRGARRRRCARSATGAPPSDAAELTIAIGSCHYLADPNPAFRGKDYGGDYQIFDAIAAKRPDLMLWLGDNVYLQTPDFLDPPSMAARYRRQRAASRRCRSCSRRRRTSRSSTITISARTTPTPRTCCKGETLTLFQRYWPNPSFGLPDVPGTFGVARYGDVGFFLLDDRYYRYPDR